MSFASHPSSVQLFVHDLEDIEGKLTELVADHTEVLILVADSKARLRIITRLGEGAKTNKGDILKSVMKTL